MIVWALVFLRVATCDSASVLNAAEFCQDWLYCINPEFKYKFITYGIWNVNNKPEID